MVNAIISLIIGARPIKQGVVSQSLKMLRAIHPRPSWRPTVLIFFLFNLFLSIDLEAS
jgi:hypothetical protein